MSCLGSDGMARAGACCLASMPRWLRSRSGWCCFTETLGHSWHSNLRGLGIGIYFSTVNIFTYGIGSPLIGKLSDVFGVSSRPGLMRYSLLVCPAACALSALMLWRGSQALTKQAQPIGP